MKVKLKILRNSGKINHLPMSVVLELKTQTFNKEHDVIIDNPLLH